MGAVASMFMEADRVFDRTAARCLAPRKPLKVSEWSDTHRRLSQKGSAEPGQWRTSRNPPLREPMDALSARSPVREVVLKWPIQFGKTEVALNFIGYSMDHDPGPIMVALPGDVPMQKWISQKLHPMIEETPAVRAALASVSSRDASNTRTFKDFEGGQLYIEHAGSPARLKSTTVKKLIVDELDEFAVNLSSGDDPVDLLDGRTSSFPATKKQLYISTPGLSGVSRIDAKFERSDQRYYHVPCPHCGHEQPLVKDGLTWTSGYRQVWYVCRDCGAVIDEHHKTDMIANGRWIPKNPESRIRGYHINALYYPLGLGPRWIDLAEMWRDAQNDPAKLKTFINDRLAETWEDPSMRALRNNAIADRAEPYALRTAPAGVLLVTAGVDTQDNRLAVHITGWGRGMTSWTLDYVELMGDPAGREVWAALTDLINTPIEHESGALIRVDATAIDAGGHRTDFVYDYVRSPKIRRPMAIFGAVPNNAPVLSKGKLLDQTRTGRSDRRGIKIYHVGTVAVKHRLYSILSADADKSQENRKAHFSADLPPEYFAGLISESYNPSKNRFEKRRGARNEPLDTWVYSYAAAHHPEVRAHRKSRSDWDQLQARLGQTKQQQSNTTAPVDKPAAQSGPESASDDGFGSDDWNL